MDYAKERLLALNADLDIKLYQEISAIELQKQLAQSSVSLVLVDVRKPYEREICRIEGSRHIPMNVVVEHMNEFNPEQTLVFHCKVGGRSAKVCQ
ncbi:rhodanese-like domain-containing protein [Photobacterium alginatilyticum]|uniref:rhodanese-like domain-containing protein n=1 Tax=Photobacterium alginatilyticum TaxID=1775171 RepID=UPI00406849ED